MQQTYKESCKNRVGVRARTPYDSFTIELICLSVSSFDVSIRLSGTITTTAVKTQDSQFVPFPIQCDEGLVKCGVLKCGV